MHRTSRRGIQRGGRTRWAVWALALPPSWSEWMTRYSLISSSNSGVLYPAQVQLISWSSYQAYNKPILSFVDLKSE